MDNNEAERGQVVPSEGFRIKGAARNTTGSREAVSVEDGRDSCTICLQPITERAVAVPCNHLSFDFICLASWLYEQAKCPLCKTDLTEIHYDWRSPKDFKVFRVPEPVPESESESRRTPRAHPYSHQSSSFRSFQRAHRTSSSSAAASSSSSPIFNPISNPSLSRRREIHKNKQYSLHIGANPFSHYRDFTSTDYASNPSLQSRTRTFLRRELQVFAFLDAKPSWRRSNSSNNNGSNKGQQSREFLTEYIVALLRKRELKGADGIVEDVVGEMLGRENARLVLHELEAWLRSPFERLEDWDEDVRYAEVAYDGDCERG